MILESILLKPGKLTEEEFNEMKTHTIIGDESIENIILDQKISTSYLRMAKNIALYHHEKYDGSSEPYRLYRDNIPLSARIFALAYDDITSNRPYKEPLSHDEAVRRVLVASETHFNPEVVKVFYKYNTKFKDINKTYNCTLIS